MVSYMAHSDTKTQIFIFFSKFIYKYHAIRLHNVDIPYIERVDKSTGVCIYCIYSSITLIFLYQNITQIVRCDLYMNT